MVENNKFPELNFLIEKTLYHRNKSEEYCDLIIEYLKDMGYLNEELILNIVNEIMHNTCSCKTPKEYMDEIFENLNIDGNF